MRVLTLFVLSLVFWCLLVWPYGGAAGGWDVQSLVVGIVVAIVAALIFSKMLSGHPARFLSPSRWFWFSLYVPVFLYYCIKANLQVVYLVLHPAMPIKPGIVKVRTRLATDSGIAALANSITLTPGTLTVDARPGELFVHWIFVETKDEEEATRRIPMHFERFLARIFE